MSDQTDEFNTVFHDRINLIGKIAQANAEQLRLIQHLSGMEILLMKEPESKELIQTMSDAEISLANSQADIDALDADLAELDARIEVTLNKET